MRLFNTLLLTAVLGLSAFFLAAQPPPASLAQTLRASRWQKRILLVGAPRADQPELRQQQKLLAAATAQLRERDFLVLPVLYDQLTPADRQYWTQELKQSLSQFSVVLIGKDGGVKRSEAQPLSPATLFDTVDKMPMRRHEAKSRKK